MTRENLILFQLCIFPGLGDWMSGYTDKLRSQADLHTLLAYQNASCNGQVELLSNYILFCGKVQSLVSGAMENCFS